MKRWTEALLTELKNMLESGKTCQECGEYFGVSRARISSLSKQFREPGKLIGKSAAVHSRAESLKRKKISKYGTASPKKRSEIQLAQARAFIRKRQNSKSTPEWEFTINFEDIDFPTYCPVLGIELDWFAEARTESSPSFDRVDPTKGYIKGNVEVISWRANRIKNDGSAEEHRAIAKWIDKKLKK